MSRVWIVVFLVTLSAFCVHAESGTFYQGVKYWYSLWDAMTIDSIRESLEEQGYEADAPAGTGFLIGPVLGFQAPSGRWSVSLALMILSEFSQDASAELLGVPLEFNTTLDRKDIDIALTYGVGSFLKVYAGFKYMLASFDIFMDTPPPGNWIHEPVAAYIPVLGVGFSYPLTEELSVSGQAGVRYAFYRIDLIDNSNGEHLDPGSVSNPWGLAAEVSLNYLAYEHLFVQVGYRFEWLHATTEIDGMKLEVDDLAHGPILAVVYLHR